MDRLLWGVVGLTTIGGALIGLAGYHLVTGRPRRPAVEAALVGAGLMLLALGLQAPAPLRMRLVIGGALVAASGSLLCVRRHRAELGPPQDQDRRVS